MRNLIHEMLNIWNFMFCRNATKAVLGCPAIFPHDQTFRMK
jgi:hypothetical protein